MGMATIQGMADENGRRRNFQLNVTKAQPLLLRKSRSLFRQPFSMLGRQAYLILSTNHLPVQRRLVPQMKHFVRGPSQLLYLYRLSSTKHEIYRNCATKSQASPHPTPAGSRRRSTEAMQN